MRNARMQLLILLWELDQTKYPRVADVISYGEELKRDRSRSDFSQEKQVGPLFHC